MTFAVQLALCSLASRPAICVSPSWPDHWNYFADSAHHYREAHSHGYIAPVTNIGLQVDWTIRLVVINSKLSGTDSFQATVERCFGKSGLVAISVSKTHLRFSNRRVLTYSGSAMGFASLSWWLTNYYD